MEMARGMQDPAGSGDDAGLDEAISDRPPSIGGDERRMHVRAYNHWVSLLNGRAYPSIEDLDPENISDFGPHSVLLDFRNGVDDPTIRYLGNALREETDTGEMITNVAQVPSRSLLSRLTDHYLQIIANRAPIGFEAEFVSTRGHNTLYRGILMPFASDGEDIDFIYGVINWKELVDDATQIQLAAEIEAARRSAPAPTLTAPIWADGPSAQFDDPCADGSMPVPAPSNIPGASGLTDRLLLARESAAAARASDTRSRASLYRALSRAYDFAVEADENQPAYQALLEEAGLTVQARAPMTPVIKLIFGADYDKTRITEFAAVLSHAQRDEVALGGLEAFLDRFEGGIKGVVAAERAVRRPPAKKSNFAKIAKELRARPSLGHVNIKAEGEFVVLLARQQDGGLDIVARVDDDPLLQRAIRKAAA